MQGKERNNDGKNMMVNGTEEPVFDPPWDLPIGYKFAPMSFVKKMISKTTDKITNFNNRVR